MGSVGSVVKLVCCSGVCSCEALCKLHQGAVAWSSTPGCMAVVYFGGLPASLPMSVPYRYSVSVSKVLDSFLHRDPALHTLLTDILRMVLCI